MSLAHAIQTRWAASSAMTSLIPASRFFTGRAPKTSTGALQPLPYATLTHPDTSVQWTGNKLLSRSFTLEFEFWAATEAEAERIRKTLEDLYENWSTDLSGGFGHLRELAPGACRAIEEDDPAEGRIWHYTFEFTAFISRERRSI